LQSKTPPDLETICLKCLQKDPRQRYATAEELAEELRRFRAGMPILARPVGRLERSWRWCKRNPALASALAAVLLTFAAGTTVLTLLGIQAITARGEAENATATARQERTDAETAHNKLQQSNDRLLTDLAHSLLSPLPDFPLGFAVSSLS